MRWETDHGLHSEENRQAPVARNSQNTGKKSETGTLLHDGTVRKWHKRLRNRYLGLRHVR